MSLICIAALLRFATIAREGYWYDESFTALIANLSPANAMQAISGDVHPPLWYVIEWLLARLAGTSPLVMRLPSAVFGTLAVYQTYLLMNKLGLKEHAPLAVALMAIMPAQLYYSQEARVYQLLNWLVLFAICSILDKNWLRSMLALSLLMYTHNLAFIYVAPLGIWLLLRARMAAIKFLPLSLSFLPWMITELSQAAHVASGFWIIEPGAGAMFVDLLYVTLFTRIPPFAQIHACIFIVFMTATAIWLSRTRRSILILAALGFSPVLLMYLVSIVWRPVHLERAVLPTGSLLMAIWSTGIGTMTSKRLRWLSLAGAPALLLALAGQVLYIKDDYHDLIDLIASNYRQGDAIYHATIPSTVFLQGYFKGIPQYVIPEVGDLNQSLTDQTKAAMGIKEREVTPQQLAEDGYTRLWLLRVLTPSSSPERLNDIDGYLATYPHLLTYRAIDKEFAKLDLYLLDLRHPIEHPYRRIW